MLDETVGLTQRQPKYKPVCAFKHRLSWKRLCCCSIFEAWNLQHQSPPHTTAPSETPAEITTLCCKMDRALHHVQNRIVVTAVSNLVVVEIDLQVDLPLSPRWYTNPHNPTQLVGRNMFKGSCYRVWTMFMFCLLRNHENISLSKSRWLQNNAETG